MMTTGEPAVFISKTSGSKKKEQEKRREQQQGPTREEVFSRVDDILAKLIQDGSTNQVSSKWWAVLRMRIRMDPRHFGSRIRMFLDLPDPLVRGTDPDPSIIKQK